MREAVKFLQVAAMMADKEIVEFLVGHGAEVNAVNNAGETSLDSAKSEDIRQLLQSYGAMSGKDHQDSKKK